MKIKIKYFSWIRVKLEKSQDIIELKTGSTFINLRNFLVHKDIFFDEIFKDETIKIFINFKEIADDNLTLNEGDEIGFLPPVTGG